MESGHRDPGGQSVTIIDPALKAQYDAVVAERKQLQAQIEAEGEQTKTSPEYKAAMAKLDEMYLRLNGTTWYGQFSSKPAPGSIVGRQNEELKRIFSMFTTDGSLAYISKSRSTISRTNIRDDVFATIKKFGAITSLKQSELEDFVQELQRMAMAESPAYASISKERAVADVQMEQARRQVGHVVAAVTEPLEKKMEALHAMLLAMERQDIRLAMPPEKLATMEKKVGLREKKKDILEAIMLQRKDTSELEGEVKS